MKDQQSIKSPAQAERPVKTQAKPAGGIQQKPIPVEVGGPKGPEPTRYGDWEQAGRCTDF